MDFNLAAEHAMAQEIVRDFAQIEVTPTIKAWDHKQEMAPHILPRMSELGILGICIPAMMPSNGRRREENKAP